MKSKSQMRREEVMSGDRIKKIREHLVDTLEYPADCEAADYYYYMDDVSCLLSEIDRLKIELQNEGSKVDTLKKEMRNLEKIICTQTESIKIAIKGKLEAREELSLLREVEKEAVEVFLGYTQAGDKKTMKKLRLSLAALEKWRSR